MKILSLGLDNSVLNKKSALAKRTAEYGNLVKKYTVIVPSGEDQEVGLSEKVQIYGAGAANKILRLFKTFGLAKKLIKQEKLSAKGGPASGWDLITVQDQYYLALIGWLLAKKFKIGLEIQVHGFEKYKGLRKMAAKFVLPRANSIRTVSQRLKKRLMDEFGVKEDKITVVPIYVDVRNLSQCISGEIGNLEKEQRNNKFIFLTVGRLVPVKNIEMQIRAFAELLKKYNNIELWIMGEGNEKRNLKLEIRNLGLEKNVKLWGWQDNLDKFYSQADVFLLTSNSEGWPLVIVEAASFSLPIIMTNVGSAEELIKDNKSGIVIPIGDQKKLEESMIKFKKDQELREKLGNNARQAVLNLPSKEEILNLYKKSWQMALKNYE